MELYRNHLKKRRAKLAGIKDRTPKQQKKLEKVRLALYRRSYLAKRDYGWDMTDEPFSMKDYLETLADQNSDYKAEMDAKVWNERARDNHIEIVWDESVPHATHTYSDEERGYVFTQYEAPKRPNAGYVIIYTDGEPSE